MKEETDKSLIIEKLLAEKEKLELTLCSIGDGVITTDIGGRILTMNKSGETITEWASESVVNNHIFEVLKLVDRDTKEPLGDLLELAIEKKEVLGLKKNTVIITKNNNIKYISASISPIKMTKGIIGVVIVFRDITRIRQAEENLSRYQVLSDKANDIIIFTDIHGNITEANNAALTSYGYNKNEIVGRSIFDLMIPDKKVPIKTQLSGTSNEGTFYEAMAKKKDGTEFFVEVSMQSTLIGSEKVLLSIQRDVTERKKTRIELEEARERAEAANYAKSEFLANMSHEIRTPLNGMLGMIDLTLLTGLNREQKENLSTAKACASNLLNLINDILDFSKIEAKKLTLENINFDISEFIEQIIKPHSIRAEEKNLKLIYKIDNRIPETLNGDSNRLKQVINNLLDNAIKFTSKGEINLGINLNYNSEETIELEFSVSDTGIGIETKDIEKVFGTFSQADSSITRKYGGTGLGLAISKHLVEMMGGCIKVESEKGKGSTFSFTVTLNHTKEKSHDTIITAEDSSAVETPLRILIAEDDMINQIVIKRMLLEAGHTVEVANNGEEVLELVAKSTFDAILMDIQMPKMDGVEAARKIRRNEKGTRRYTPIIALTAYALEGDKEKYISLGMDGYISKPIRINDLLKTIEMTVKKIKEEKQNQSIKDEDYIVSENIYFQNKKDYFRDISINVKFLEDALLEGNFTLIEEYSAKIIQLSTEADLKTIKTAFFKLQLASRKEDLSAVTLLLKNAVKKFEESFSEKIYLFRKKSFTSI
ncbi:MAG: PAS domain S-box protein [Firmicutes bacterium]|nr:PAS domain S-box protein [Bacillota bacterium]